MPDDPAFTLGKQRLWSRKERYHAMRKGLLFKVTHQTPSTVVTGQTSFDEATPTFLLRQASASREIVGARIWLGQAGTVAGGAITIAIAIDPADRLSGSTGTPVAIQNSDADSSAASSATFRYSATATAASSDTRYVWAASAPATLGTVTMFDFEDGLGIGTTGSLLIYTWAVSTGPSWVFGVEWLEE